MAYLSIFYIAIVFMFSFGYRQNQPHALINYILYIYIVNRFIEVASNSIHERSLIYKLTLNATITFHRILLMCCLCTRYVLSVCLEELTAIILAKHYLSHTREGENVEV